MLFDIPIIGLFEAVGFEHYTLHHAQNNNLLTQKNNNQALGQADDSEPVPLANLTEHEQTVFDILETTEQTIDTIIAKSDLPTPTVSVALLGLEMKRLAKQLPGKLFARR